MGYLTPLQWGSGGTRDPQTDSQGGPGVRLGMSRVLGGVLRLGSRASVGARVRRTTTEKERPGVLAVLERLRLGSALTVACMTAVASLGLACAAASARAEENPPVPENTPITLTNEQLKVAAGASVGAAAGGATAAAVLYTIIKNAIAASKPEKVVPELSAVASPLQMKTALLDEATAAVDKTQPKQAATVAKDADRVLTHLGPSAIAPPCTNSSACEDNTEKQVIDAERAALKDPNLTPEDDDVLGAFVANTELEVQTVAQVEKGRPFVILPPLPALPAQSPSASIKDPEQRDAVTSAVFNEIDQKNAMDAEADSTIAQEEDAINGALIGKPLPPSGANAPQDVQFAAQNSSEAPGLGQLPQLIGEEPGGCPGAVAGARARAAASACPLYPLRFDASGDIQTTVGELDTLSANADKQATGITQQTAFDVKGELSGQLTPQQVLSDETGSETAGLEADSVAAQLPEQVLMEGKPGAGVSAAATAADGAVKQVASEAAQETAAVGSAGAADGAEAAIEAGESAASVVDPLMLVQIATQLPQIITQVVQMIKGEPSFEQQVLSSLGSIKEQISALTQQVQEGFSYVDETLRGVDVKIEQATQLLEHVAANGSQLQSELAEITGKLDQIQATLYRIAESAREETLHTALNTYIGYDQRFGEELPLPEFAKALGVFFTWGNESSLNAVSEHKGGSRAPNQVAAELQETEGANALNENLDYLASFANHAGWLDQLPALNENAPNPEVWAAASNAYSQLLLENPGDVTKGVRPSLGELESVGEALQPFIREIGEKGSLYKTLTVAGINIDTGSSILNHALANYLNSAIATSAGSGTEPSLANRVQAQENATLAAQPAGAADESYGHCAGCVLATAPTTETGNTGQTFIDPWGGTEQTPSQSLPTLEATSDPQQQTAGGVSTFGQMNMCRTASESNLAEFGEEGAVHGVSQWEPDAVLIPLTNFSGFHVPSLGDPLAPVYANAWHLGFGRLFACYAVEHNFVFEKGVLPGIKFQVNYMWERPGGSKVVVLRITITDPLPNTPSGCFWSNPVQTLRSLWSLEVEEERLEKREEPACWKNELQFNTLSESVGRITNWVQSHPAREEPGLKLKAAECHKQTGAALECEVSEGVAGGVPGGLGGEIETRLVQLRHDVIKGIAEPNASESLSEEAPADVQAAAVRVNGARALLDDYIELGMPKAMTNDPALRDFVQSVGDNLAADEKVGDHLLDNSPGAPNIYSLFTREFGEIEKGGHPASLWPAAFPPEGSCFPFCPVELKLEKNVNPVQEIVTNEKSPGEPSISYKLDHDGILLFDFKREAEKLAGRIRADLKTEATPAVVEEPMIEGATAQLGLTRDLLSIPPVLTKAPEVTGNAVAGETLNCSPGSWEPRPPPTFTYSWLRNATSVGEGPTHLVTEGDVGQELTCEVTARNREGEVTSATSGSVTALATPVLPLAPGLAVQAAREVKSATPQVLSNPNLTVRTAQKLKGSKGGFTTHELTVKLGRGVAAGRHHQKAEVIEYEITVTNTGNVPVALSKLSDRYCAHISSAEPVGKQLQPGRSVLYRCQRAVSRAGTYINQATIQATPPAGEGFTISRTSNKIAVRWRH